MGCATRSTSTAYRELNLNTTFYSIHYNECVIKYAKERKSRGK